MAGPSPASGVRAGSVGVRGPHGRSAAEAPAEDLITFRQVLTQVLGYGRADAVPTRAGI